MGIHAVDAVEVAVEIVRVTAQKAVVHHAAVVLPHVLHRVQTTVLALVTQVVSAAKQSVMLHVIIPALLLVEAVQAVLVVLEQDKNTRR